MNKGYIYIIFNEMYNYYGSNVFKIGKTQDINQRTKQFITSYIEPVEIKFLSEEVKNYTLAEQEVFKVLYDQRIKPNREFFKIDNLKDTINKIEKLIDEINLISDEEIELKLEQNKTERTNKNNKLINNMKKIHLDDVDIIIELLKPHSELTKVKMLNEFEKFHNIERFDINFNNFNKFDKMNDIEFLKFKKTFRSIKQTPKTKDELNKVYIGFLRNLFSEDRYLILAHKTKRKNKNITIYYFNPDTIDKVKHRINENNSIECLSKEYLIRYLE